jgi:hypothetical protein
MLNNLEEPMWLPDLTSNERKFPRLERELLNVSEIEADSNQILPGPVPHVVVVGELRVSRGRSKKRTLI